jgi:hypothetical protein
MIFGSIALLIVAGGLLTAGIAKSSTGFLALSLVCTGAAGLLLIVAYAAARGATGLNTKRDAQAGTFPGTPAAGVVYIPVPADQAAKLLTNGSLGDGNEAASAKRGAASPRRG